jgi:hypothetical protein
VFETEKTFVPVVAQVGIVTLKVFAVALVVESVRKAKCELPQIDTVIVAVKCLPVTITAVGEVVGPLCGLSEVTVGLAKYVKLSVEAVPPGLVIVMCFVPAVAQGGRVTVNDSVDET